MNKLKKESRTHPRIIRISDVHHKFLIGIAKKTNLPLTRLLEMVLDEAMASFEIEEDK